MRISSKIPYPVILYITMFFAPTRYGSITLVMDFGKNGKSRTVRIAVNIHRMASYDIAVPDSISRSRSTILIISW